MVQFVNIKMFRLTHIEMQHRIFDPLFFQLLDSQPFEKFFTSLEVTLERADQQGFPESSRTAEENVTWIWMSKIIDIFCLIYIQVILLPKVCTPIG